MQQLGENLGSKTRVNVLKKVKVNRSWQLCPVVVEPSGKLKDKVRIQARTEVYTEGVYYIEWREHEQRRRQAVPNRYEVLEQARLKALELDAIGHAHYIRQQVLGQLSALRPHDCARFVLPWGTCS